MKSIVLVLFCLVLASKAAGNDCDQAWLPSKGKNGTLLCIKVFLDQNFDTLDDAADACSKKGGFLAPMSTSQQERAIRDSASRELSPHIANDKPMLLYVGSRKHRQNSTFYWSYDGSEVAPEVIQNSISSNKIDMTDASQNCLVFEWNAKQLNSSISLERTSCNCVVTGNCRAKVAGFVCAKHACPLKYELFGSMCYRLINDVNPEISVNSAAKECRKIPGGNLATLGDKKTAEHFGEQSSFTAIGLRCPDTYRDMFEGETNDCNWDDGTPYKYNNFDPKTLMFGGCTQLYFTGYWQNGVNCDAAKFSSYICQAPFKLYKP